MKKFQMIAVLILSLFLMFSCVPEDEEEEEFQNNEQADTLPDGNSGVDTDSAADTLPDGQQDSDTDSSDTIPDDTDTTDDQTEQDVTDTATDDSEKPDTTPGNDNEPADDSDDEMQLDEDSETTTDTDTNTNTDTDNDSAPSDDSDLTDDDVEPTTDDDNEPATDDDNEPTTDNDSEPSTGLPECSNADITPCKDSSSSYVWSKKSPDKMSWSEADNFCKTLTDGGFSWRMPEIYELRTLIQNCSGSQSSNTSCMIAEDCFTSYACIDGCSSCSATSNGIYSKLGDSDTLWSASILSDNYAWVLYFSDASLDYAKQSGNAISPAAKWKTRCIKK